MRVFRLFSSKNARERVKRQTTIEINHRTLFLNTTVFRHCYSLYRVLLSSRNSKVNSVWQKDISINDYIVLTETRSNLRHIYRSILSIGQRWTPIEFIKLRNLVKKHHRTMERASEDTAKRFKGGQGRCVGHGDTETSGETTETSNDERPGTLKGFVGVYLRRSKRSDKWPGLCRTLRGWFPFFLASSSSFLRVSPINQSTRATTHPPPLS